MTLEVTRERLKEQLDALHKEDIYNALDIDGHNKFTVGDRITIHQYVGQGIKLSDRIAADLLEIVLKNAAHQRPKCYYNDNRILITKET
jgi:hypothetical protein